MNKRLLFLTFRNTAIGIGFIVGIFTFGFIVLFLNQYLGSAVFSLAFVSLAMLLFIVGMSYNNAKDQIERERRRGDEVMATLKRKF